ncbi:carbonic anhydrase [Mycena pura]|uniref:Carbonic anhydrase n=1 Tax=Mycena pura TaxID=153505 RepID=A0AAD6YC48_9AGAR|nr:carbonic anhydrase [Mycena pura]
MSVHPNAHELRASNATWAAKILASDPKFFERLAQGQQPKVLWIGCSDSREPETTICNGIPGDIFTHRNIANMVPPGVDCVESVIEYAVNVVGVQDIVVAGHTKCGGVEAAWLASREPGTPRNTPVERWLVPLIELSRELRLNTLPLDRKEDAVRALTEENVRRQLDNIRHLPFIHGALHRLSFHPWVFHLERGVLVDITLVRVDDA